MSTVASQIESRFPQRQSPGWTRRQKAEEPMTIEVDERVLLSDLSLRWSNGNTLSYGFNSFPNTADATPHFQHPVIIDSLEDELASGDEARKESAGRRAGT
jgi:hypothetical protein